MTISIIQSKSLLEAGFFYHGFTARKGGVSEGPYSSLNLAFDIGDPDENVKANLLRLKEFIAADAPLSRAKQVHGVTVVNGEETALSSWCDRPSVEADAIVCGKGVIAAVQTADCAPVLIACPQSRIVAAVHAGWKGAAAGIVRNVMRVMESRGANLSAAVAVIGPRIGYPCYEVGEDVASSLVESADPVPRQPGKYYLDLANAVEVSLITGGISTARIERVGDCTHCQEADFFSYRKSGGTCGRMLAYIGCI